MTQSNAKPIVKLDIDALSYGPYGVGRVDGKAVMVPHTDRQETRSKRALLNPRSAMPIGEIVRCFALKCTAKSTVPLRRRLRRLLLAAHN